MLAEIRISSSGALAIAMQRPVWCMPKVHTICRTATNRYAIDNEVSA